MIILDILITLSTSSTIVKDILNKGGHLFAVDLLCNGDNESGLRDKSAMFLSRLMTEKLSGPRLRLALAQILPLAIVDTMRDLPSSTVRLLDNDQENPELVWNEKSRIHIFGNVNKISRE
jgi:DnaJ family protein C protein 13